jgi:hypothetical protein
MKYKGFSQKTTAECFSSEKEHDTCNYDRRNHKFTGFFFEPLEAIFLNIF